MECESMLLSSMPYWIHCYKHINNLKLDIEQKVFYWAEGSYCDHESLKPLITFTLVYYKGLLLKLFEEYNSSLNLSLINIYTYCVLIFKKHIKPLSTNYILFQRWQMGDTVE